MKIKFIYPLTLIFLMKILTLSAQDQANVSHYLKKYLENFHQQKVYVHLDKETYNAGEIMWFKAYVLEATSHIPDKNETNLNIELYYSDGRLVQSELLRVKNGYTHGDLTLKDSIPSGNYVFRAYTPQMMNFGESFYFIKDIYVFNPLEENFISRKVLRQNRNINKNLERKEREYLFDYFYEGGICIIERNNRVAFHARDGLGNDIKVNGVLKDNTGKIITNIETIFKGRGELEFVPEKNQKYYLEVVFPDHKTKSLELQGIKNAGVGLQVKQGHDNLTVTLKNHFEGTIPEGFATLYLLVHTRGKIISSHEITDLSGFSNIEVSLNLIPAGVTTISLFDNQAALISERLVFQFEGENLNHDILVYDESLDDYTVKLISPYLETDPFAYSVSVVSTSPNEDSILDNILSYILLQSDIKHPVTESWDFFNQARKHMDLLMMTNTWKRFQWKDVIRNDYPELVNKPIAGYSLNGLIHPNESSKALSRNNFSLTFQPGEAGGMQTTVTDQNGYFRFEGIEVYGDFSAQLTLEGLNGSEARKLELFPKRSVLVPYEINPNTRPRIEKRGAYWQRGKSPKAVTSDRITVIPDPISQTRRGSADQVIYLKINDERYRNLEDVLKMSTTGILVDGNRIQIRGANSIMLSSQPLLMVDEAIVSSSHFLTLSPMQISHVEIFKGSSASMFGLKGANGVLVAHSRRYSGNYINIFNYILSGYYLHREFKDFVQIPHSLEYNASSSTLLWQPYVRFTEEGEFNLKIPKPSVGNELIITLNGVDQQGNIIFTREKLILE